MISCSMVEARPFRLPLFWLKTGLFSLHRPGLSGPLVRGRWQRPMAWLPGTGSRAIRVPGRPAGLRGSAAAASAMQHAEARASVRAGLL